MEDYLICINPKWPPNWAENILLAVYSLSEHIGTWFKYLNIYFKGRGSFLIWHVHWYRRQEAWLVQCDKLSMLRFGSYGIGMRLPIRPSRFKGTCLWSAYQRNCWTIFVLRGIQQLHNRCSCALVFNLFIDDLAVRSQITSICLGKSLLLSTCCGHLVWKLMGPLFCYLESSNHGIDAVVHGYTFTLIFWWPHREVHIILFFHVWSVYQRSCWIAVPLYMYDIRQL